MWEGEGQTAALGTQTCYQSMGHGLCQPPGAVLLGCLFLARRCGVEYVGRLLKVLIGLHSLTAGLASCWGRCFL